MADKKIRLKKQKQDGTYDYLFPATKSSIVDVNGKTLDVVLAETDGKFTAQLAKTENDLEQRQINVLSRGLVGDGVSDDTVALKQSSAESASEFTPYTSFTRK